MSDQRPHVVQYVTEGRDNFAALRPQQEGRSGLPNKMHTIMHIAALLTTCTAAATYTSAFSTIESVESAVAIASGILLELSPQQLIDCMPNPKHCGGRGGCEGATQSLGFEYVRQQGGSFLISRSVGGPGRWKSWVGGRKQKTKNRGGAGAQPSEPVPVEEKNQILAMQFHELDSKPKSRE